MMQCSLHPYSLRINYVNPFRESTDVQKELRQMTARSHSRGHHIEYNGKEWIWTDTKEPIEENERPCKRCGRMPTPEGHDACLGTLEGVSSACCGHGIKEPYIIREAPDDVLR